MSIVRVLVLIGILATSLNLMAADSKEAKETKALAAANSWLALVDKKDYKASWEETAGFFKSKVTAREWERTVAAVRSPFGNLISRKLKAKVYTTTLPGAPEGEYVVIQFDSQYQNRKDVSETITPMLDDSIWKVSGYFAK